MFNMFNWGIWLLIGGTMIWGGILLSFCGLLILENNLSVYWLVELNYVGFSLTVELLWDYYSLCFIGGVLVISGSVLVYSMSYMEGEKYLNRFLCLLSVFVLSMILLIISTNLIQLILGWDGLGVSSYLLICYYNNSNSCNAGGLTLMMNRFGDVGLFLVMFYFLVSSHHILNLSFNLKILGALMLITSCTKSAQIPFSAWLPAAMAAPTPVSSLVHSSTLVTAGVYLMIRFSNSLKTMGGWVAMVGIFTSLIATAVAMVESDMKKIVAFSTMSHLGIMVCMIGFGWASVSYTHLLFHAFFKALLFLVVGYWIHSHLGYQSLKKVSVTLVKDPIVGVFGGVAIMSLCGLPYMTGFYSKDMFMELVIQYGSGVTVLMISLFSMLGSFLYSTRLFCTINKLGNLPSLYSWGGGLMGYVTSMLILMLASVLVGGGLNCYLPLGDNILYVMVEVKLLIFSGLLGCILLALGMKIKSRFLSEIIYLSFLSRVIPNYILSSSVKMVNLIDSNYMNFFYNNYRLMKFSSLASCWVGGGYLESLMGMFLILFLVLTILG